MQLTYRGIQYDYNPPTVDISTIDNIKDKSRFLMLRHQRKQLDCLARMHIRSANEIGLMQA